MNLFYKGQKALFPKVQLALKENKHQLFWVHCSSVGEFEQGLPIIELLKKENPSWKVVVTFFSPSGYYAIKNSIVDYQFYIPIDTPLNARQFIQIIKPKIVLFIKYEFWYNFLKELKKQNINTYSVSSIFRESQLFFRWYGGWGRKMLHYFTYFMVQDQSSLALLKSINITNAQQTGDTRFDRVEKIKHSAVNFSKIERFINEKKVFIIGSLRPEDDKVIFGFIKLNTDYKFIIAPHQITEKHLSKIERALNSTIRHSELGEETNKNILIIDSIGILSRLYKLANFAYIGGGFSDGIHNILEPAVYSIPIFFGNQYYKKYKEAVDLEQLDLVFPISNTLELNRKFNQIKNKNTTLNISTQLSKYIAANIGASRRVINCIKQQKQ